MFLSQTVIMNKGFILKIVLLLVTLGGVIAVIVALVWGNSAAGTADSARTQTFFEQFVIAGGPIVWFVLLPMSLIMVFLSVEHSLTIRRSRLLPEGVGNEIIEIMRHQGAGQLQSELGRRDDFVSTSVHRAVTHGGGDWHRMRNLLFESLEERAMVLLRKIEWVNLIGNISPMVGLFGTVFGMIKLFNAIVIAGGQPQATQLAAGISVALVTTFWGLLIAIPALAVHWVFRNRIETLVSAATTEAENILPRLRKSLKIQRQDPAGTIGKTKPPIVEFRTKSATQVRQS